MTFEIFLIITDQKLHFIFSGKGVPRLSQKKGGLHYSQSLFIFIVMFCLIRKTALVNNVSIRTLPAQMTFKASKA